MSVLRVRQGLCDTGEVAVYVDGAPAAGCGGLQFAVPGGYGDPFVVLPAGATLRDLAAAMLAALPPDERAAVVRGAQGTAGEGER